MIEQIAVKITDLPDMKIITVETASPTFLLSKFVLRCLPFFMNG